jgi:small multidrug resistance family-3 protein
MFKALQSLPPIAFLVVATSMEALGDALVRRAIHDPLQAPARLGLLAAGGLLLLGYGTSLNLAPIEFSRVAGLYIATLFVIWQLVNFIVFRGLPSTPVLAGGALIVLGGLIVTYWKG